MNSETARKVTVRLDFLGGKGAAMRLWSDGEKPDAPQLVERRVADGEELVLDLAAHGGAAAILTEK